LLQRTVANILHLFLIHIQTDSSIVAQVLSLAAVLCMCLSLLLSLSMFLPHLSLYLSVLRMSLFVFHTHTLSLLDTCTYVVVALTAAAGRLSDARRGAEVGATLRARLPRRGGGVLVPVAIFPTVLCAHVRRAAERSV
jgi:hypothetical protein